VEFSVLGPLEVTADGRLLELPGARTRAVLALLLVHANQVVSSDRLIEELWPGHPPAKAPDSLQVRLSELRKAWNSPSNPARTCGSCRPVSCARIRRSTAPRAGLTLKPGPFRRSGTPRPATASTSPTWSPGRANGTSCSCPA
jgi:hypothetical protein